MVKLSSTQISIVGSGDTSGGGDSSWIVDSFVVLATGSTGIPRWFMLLPV